MTYRSVGARLAPDADADRFRLLGEGLWGSVVDLGDGSVMKLIRQGNGLGNAFDLWRRETRALAALADHPLPCAVPRLIDCGMTDAEGEAARAGWVAWIRMSRLPGSALDDDQVVALTPAKRKRLAEDLGTTLAALHELRMPGGFGDLNARVDTSYLDEIEPEIADVADFRLMAALRTCLADIALSTELVPNHGDINTTNIMVDADGRLTGLTDWAEARLDWAEAELCLLRFWPEFLAPVRAAYETRRGLRLDDRRLDVGALQSALLTIAIARRQGDTEAETWGLEWADRLRPAVLGPTLVNQI